MDHRSLRGLLFFLFYMLNFNYTNGIFESLSLMNQCTDPEKQYMCSDRTCILWTQRCDGINQCSDASDELDCDSFLCKSPAWFKCKKTHYCISGSFVCDGEDDCEDLSDEENCDKFKLEPHPIICESDQWQCKDTLCIPKEFVCDGTFDCIDHSDETAGCKENLKCDGFKCTNGVCIAKEWVCDGNNDCGDGSDEVNCHKKIPPEHCTVENKLYLCHDNQTCIDLSSVCNKVDNCPDKSDEGIKCFDGNMSCSVHKCSHECIQMPDGPFCLCPEGYKQISDNFCTDLNECETYGICDQKCRNLPGSYDCYCDDKYELQSDKKSCKAIGGEPLLVFSSKKQIRGLRLTSGLYFLIAGGLKQVIGVSYDGEHVYWTDLYSENESIVRSLEDGSQRELIVTSGLNMPEDLAVDWITGNIYFTDAAEQHIGVCTNDGVHCTVLVNEDINKPRAIALHPERGEMYWSDWGKRPEIARSKMDGKDDISFVSNNIRWPNGITIDYPNERLYWLDAKLLTIESILLDGTDRRIILQNIVKHPYSITIFEDRLYWSDWHTKTIESCNKFTGKNRRTLLHEKEDIYGMHIYHSAVKQKYNNPCEHSMCSDMCLLSGRNSYSCACPQDKTLNPNKHTCRETVKKHIMVVAAGGLLIKVHHKMLGKHDIAALPVSFEQINSLAYDSINGQLIVSDNELKRIFIVSKDETEFKTLLSQEIGFIEGMDFDYFGNNLYWCDSIRETVEVYSMATKQRKIILHDLAGEAPLDVALIPEEGVMFVAIRRLDSTVHIDRMHMNGNGRTHVIEQGLIGPNINLVYDYDLERVFWADSGTGNIESTSVDGDDRHGFRSLQTEPVGLAILGTDLFWTNMHSRRLYWANKLNAGDGYNKKITLDLPRNLKMIHLVSIPGVRTGDNHICLIQNGNCSHFCLLSQKQAICACPIGQLLNPHNNRTCIIPETCSIDQFKCSFSNQCIPKKYVCDGRIDCTHSEDELDCNTTPPCSDGKIKCKNGECIKEALWCDTHYDCIDHSDEMNCDTKKCKSNEFNCKNGNCIETKYLCDKYNDCMDNSDEDDCYNITCSKSEFRCNNGKCIPSSWECDNEIDCPDTSDEHAGCEIKKCAPDMFTCKNKRCIDKKLVCNNIDDCVDYSDELNCFDLNDTFHNLASITKLLCFDDEFQCESNSTLCLPQKSRCDGISECPRGEDEMNCSNCQLDEFQCKNGKCIQITWMCDHRDDCGDKSDEDSIICSNPVPSERSRHFIPCDHGFQCKNGDCIDWKFVCNNVKDCIDGSDENGACEISCERGANTCEDICVKTPSGQKCTCHPGYTLRGDFRTCVDINECDRDLPPCSQICKNTIGSFKCDCYTGFELRGDRKSCKAIGEPMTILFSSNNEIRQISPYNNNLYLIFDEDTPKITGLDVSVKHNLVYFSIQELGSIYKMYLANKTYDYIAGVGKPLEIVVDWITNNIYYVDSSEHKSLKVCHMEEQKCAHILNLDLGTQISALAIDAVNKYLFYAVTSWWVFNNPSSIIYKVNLDGTKNTELVNENLGLVNGINFDTNKKILYYTDQHNNKIEKVKYDSSERTIVWQNKTTKVKPHGLNLYEDHLFFLIPNGHMMRCKLFGEQTTCIDMRLHLYTADLFVISQESRQKNDENICSSHNCSHLCIQSEVGVKCICENGHTILENVICSPMTKLPNNTPIKRQGISSDIISGKQDEKSNSTLIGIVVAIFIVAALFGGVYYLRRKHYMRSFNPNFNTYFQNPVFGLPDHSSENVYMTRAPTTSSTASLTKSEIQPGEHEYVNPLQIHKSDIS